MQSFNRLPHGLAAAALVTVGLATPAAAFAAPRPAAPPERQPIEVTAQDVAASNQKIRMVFADLVSMWSADFAKIGARFEAPHLARYESDVLTSCGVMHTDNAEYCARDNTVYFDDVFVAGIEKSAAQALGTDGDMAGLGIIAHEMGHAVAMQLGHDYASSYANESTADCLSGAFVQQSQREGSLEKGDLDEALYGLSLAGDPTPKLTGNRRYDAMMLARLEHQSHGTSDQRLQNFRTGLNGGPGACLDDFRAVQ